jgi:hypothetical protein
MSISYNILFILKIIFYVKTQTILYEHFNIFMFNRAPMRKLLIEKVHSFDLVSYSKNVSNQHLERNMKILIIYIF